MAVPDKGKKPRLDEEQYSCLSPDPNVSLCIDQLREVQAELDKITEEATDNMEVHDNFSDLSKPIYEKRNELIKSIPDFWLNAFMSHPFLRLYLNREDRKIFSYLISVEMDEFKGEGAGYGYTFIFHFEENPYFEGEMLTKTFTFSEKEIVDKITGATIKWKADTAYAKGVRILKRRRWILASKDSFFCWFTEPLKKSMEEVQVEIALMIKEELWPDPLRFFEENEASE